MKRAAQEERDRARKEREKLDSELRRLQALLAKLEAEEVKLRRRLTAGSLNAYEVETIYRRLATIGQERVHGTNHLESCDLDALGIQFQILNLEEQREWNKLSAGGLTEQETAGIRRRLADIKHEREILHSRSIQEDEEEMERRRRNRSGSSLILVEPSGCTGGYTDTEAGLRHRAARDLAKLHKRIARLDVQEQALLHRIKNGNQNVCGNHILKEQIAHVRQQRQELILAALDTEQKELERRLSNDAELQSTEAEKEAWHTRIEEINAEKAATTSTIMAAKDTSESSMASALLAISSTWQNEGSDAAEGKPHDTLPLSGGLAALQQTSSSISLSSNQQDRDDSHSSYNKSHGRRKRSQRSRRKKDESWRESMKWIDPTAELAARTLPPVHQEQLDGDSDTAESLQRALETRPDLRTEDQFAQIGRQQWAARLDKLVQSNFGGDFHIHLQKALLTPKNERTPEQRAHIEFQKSVATMSSNGQEPAAAEAGLKPHGSLPSDRAANLVQMMTDRAARRENIVTNSSVLDYSQALLRLSPPKHADRKGYKIWITSAGFKYTKAETSPTRQLAPLELKALRRSPSGDHERPWSRGATTYVAPLPLVPRHEKGSKPVCPS